MRPIISNLKSSVHFLKKTSKLFRSEIFTRDFEKQLLEIINKWIGSQNKCLIMDLQNYIYMKINSRY